MGERRAAPEADPRVNGRSVLLLPLAAWRTSNRTRALATPADRSRGGNEPASPPTALRSFGSSPPSTPMRPASSPPVPVADRLHRPHPVIARLRDDENRLAVPQEQRRRSLLILQAVAATAVERGRNVADQPAEQHDHRTYHQRAHHQREGKVHRNRRLRLHRRHRPGVPRSQSPVKAETLKIEVPYSRARSRHERADRKTMIPAENRLAAAGQHCPQLATRSRISSVSAGQRPRTSDFRTYSRRCEDDCGDTVLCASVPAGRAHRST